MSRRSSRSSVTPPASSRPARVARSARYAREMSREESVPPWYSFTPRSSPLAPRPTPDQLQVRCQDRRELLGHCRLLSRGGEFLRLQSHRADDAVGELKRDQQRGALAILDHGPSLVAGE